MGRKSIFIAVAMVFLVAGWAQADTMGTLSMGGSYTYPIYLLNGATQETWGGGSIDVSYLNGKQLAYLYCVDIAKEVYVPATYSNSVISTAGNILRCSA